MFKKILVGLVSSLILIGCFINVAFANLNMENYRLKSFAENPPCGYPNCIHQAVIHIKHRQQSGQTVVRIGQLDQNSQCRFDRTTPPWPSLPIPAGYYSILQFTAHIFEKDENCAIAYIKYAGNITIKDEFTCIKKNNSGECTQTQPQTSYYTLY